MNHKTDWFKERKWGVFTHYLYQVQNNPASETNDGAGETGWDECVNALDVELLARQLYEINAGYLIFTVMQQSRYMIAPNNTFDRLTGYAPGQACAARDLIGDLYNALEKYNIALFLYFTGDGPTHDEKAASGIKGTSKFPVEDGFVRLWASVLEEYSVRYGEKIKGWWVDGLYEGIGYNDDNIKIVRDAALKGNPDALFSANYLGCLSGGENKYIEGIGDTLFGNFYHEIVAPTKYCDYTAGEVVNFDAYPHGRFIGNAQSHVLSFLGIPPEPIRVYDGWAKSGSKYSGGYMRRYIECVNKIGGVVSVDVCLHRSGSIDKEQLSVLNYLKNIR